MSITTVFFDFDGVIKDSTEVKTDAFKCLYLPFGEDVAEKVVAHHIQNGGVSRFEKFKIYHSQFLGVELNDEQIDEMASKFSRLVLQKVVDSAYVKGALETIRILAHERYNLHIITGTPQNEMEYICSQLEITNYFKGIHGSPTNKIDWCTELIRAQGYKNEEILFVGDALTDYEAAKFHSLHFSLREHDENKKYFTHISCDKRPDLTELYEKIINWKQ